MLPEAASLSLDFSAVWDPSVLGPAMHIVLGKGPNMFVLIGGLGVGGVSAKTKRLMQIQKKNLNVKFSI